jgi:hypothetical protein
MGVEPTFSMVGYAPFGDHIQISNRPIRRTFSAIAEWLLADPNWSDGQRARWIFTSCLMSRDSHPLIL